MNSNAKEIRDSFKKMLEDGAIHSRTELFMYARQARPDKNYSEGMLTGALKTLTDPGTGYKNVGRALYQKADVDSGNYVDNLIDSYVEILKKTIETIEGDVHINPFKLMDLNEEDKRKLKKIENCIADIQAVISELEQ